jgi:anti-sigma factor RsiW
MECRDVRELADSFLSQQLLVETTHEIVRHLAQCPSCRGEIESRRLLRTAVRGAFERSPDLRPSPDFLASIGERVRARESRRRPRNGWRTALSIAASVLLVAGSLFGGREWLGASRFAALARAAAGDHRNCAVRFGLKERPISLQDAAQRFDPAYGTLVAVGPSPERLPAGELTVLERHACLFDGRRFAHIVLRYRGNLASVLVTPDRLARIPPEVQSADATRVASFRVGRFAAFVVSSASDEEVRAIAAAFAWPLTVALKGA